MASRPAAGCFSQLGLLPQSLGPSRLKRKCFVRGFGDSAILYRLKSSNDLSSQAWKSPTDKLKLTNVSVQGHEPVATIPLPGKAFGMSVSGNTLAVATSKREILAFDVRRLLMHLYQDVMKACTSRFYKYQGV